MKYDRQVGRAIGGSLIVHLLLAGGATTMLAIQRASPPPNDAFSEGRWLGDERGGSAFGDCSYATRESGEPFHAAGAGGGSVWWRWRAPKVSCAVEVQVVGDGFDEVVVVYRGAVLETLAEVASRRAGDGAALAFVAEPGTVYHVVVAGASANDYGEIELRIHADPDLEKAEPEELVLLLPEMLNFEPVVMEPDQDDPAFSRSDGEETDPVVPEDARFQSDRDRAAAGEQPPEDDGEEGVGSQDGEDDLPFVPLLEVTPLWQTDSGPSPSADGFVKVPEIEMPATEPVEPAEEVASAFALEDVPVEAEEVVPAAVEEVPAVAPRPPETPMESSPAIRPEAVKARTIGKAEVGPATAVATAETPIGRYQAAIDEGVQLSSERVRALHKPFEKLGFLKVRLWVNREGAVVNTKVLFSDATAEMEKISLRGLREAKLPPMPDEVYSAAPDGLVDMVYDIFF